MSQMHTHELRLLADDVKLRELNPDDGLLVSSSINSCRHLSTNAYSSTSSHKKVDSRYSDRVSSTYKRPPKPTANNPRSGKMLNIDRLMEPDASVT